MIARALIAGAVLSIIVIVAVTYAMPPIDDFHPGNPFWNGLSALASELRATDIEDFKELGELGSPQKIALIIIGPSENFTDTEITEVKEFVSLGGLLIIADDFGTGNQIIQGLGLGVRINGSLLADPLFMERTKYLPKVFLALGNGTGFTNESMLILNYASVLEGSRDYEILAQSSSFSYLDLNMNSEHDGGEPTGPFPVAIKVRYGSGEIIIISDPSLFINSMIDKGKNLEFAKGLVEGRDYVVIDSAHLRMSTFSVFKAQVLAFLNFLRVPEVRYSIVLLTMIGISAVSVNIVRREFSEADEVLRKHPSWDGDLLRRLEEEMRRVRQ